MDFEKRTAHFHCNWGTALGLRCCANRPLDMVMLKGKSVAAAVFRVIELSQRRLRKWKDRVSGRGNAPPVRVLRYRWLVYQNRRIQ
jgi:hypothetical protein